MAANLDKLPDEILLQITSHLSSKTLRVLTLTSHNLHRFVNPILYNSIYFSAGVPTSVKYNDPPFRMNEEWMQSHHILKVFDIHRLRRSLEANSKLRSLVKHANITLTSEQAQVRESILALLRLSEVKELHIAPVTFTLGLLGSVPVTSLDVRYSDFASSYNEYGDRPWDNIYSIFCVPTLRRLQLRGMKTGGELKNLTPDSPRARTSPITHLRLPDSLPACENLAELLTWPIALKSFYVEVWPQAHGPWYGYHPRASSIENLIQTLYPQRASLQDLFINTKAYMHPGNAPTNGTKLQDFPKLSRMGIDQNLMCYRAFERKSSGLRLKGCEMVTNTMGELFLEFNDGFRWYEELTGPETSPFSIKGKDVETLLLDIALRKKDENLRLTKIVLWKTIDINPEGRAREDYLDFVKDSTMWSGLVTVMGAVGIELECSGDYDAPPLFTLR